MARYLPPLADRFAAGVKDLVARVGALEARTAMLNGADRLYALWGTVDPGYTAGDPQVTVDGDAGLTGPYPYLRPYAPAPSDRVLLVPSGASYAVAGTGTAGAGVAGVPALAGQRGAVNAVWPGATNNLTVTVTFPTAFPAAPSAVFFSGPLLDLFGPVFAVGVPTATQFQCNIQRRDGGNVSAGTRVCYWLAVA